MVIYGVITSEAVPHVVLVVRKDEYVVDVNEYKVQVPE